MYIYILKNRPYTDIIIMNDKTVINRLPIMVTSHKGMLAQNPTFSIADSIVDGNDTLAPPMPPIPAVTCVTTPPHISYIFVIISIA